MRSCSMVDEEKWWSKKPASQVVQLLKEDDLDLSEKQESGKPSSKRQYVARPEPQAMDFTVRPQSKVSCVDQEIFEAKYITPPIDDKICSVSKILNLLQRPDSLDTSFMIT
ncbi:hypothetical protein AQUCO_13500001v1 [Aquilegia coerulea]|uniref:Uncharacterized protein n=1 Tax=Aquilegia coerulea TaxID=218851 RepID=A0A2G5C114_AQUCA|nr:hypothetical protein AQUCO_13500001v1 [Aquilegia coerulea]